MEQIYQLNSMLLTSREREHFTNIFYEMMPHVTDWDTTNPWGCPWFFGFDVYLTGNSMEERVKNYIDQFSCDIDLLNFCDVKEE